VTGKTVAVVHGAATIINAIALGKGAAFGVDLWTKAEVKLTDDPGVIRAEITSDPKESTLLIEKTVSRVLQLFQFRKILWRKSENSIKHPHCQRAQKQ